MTASSGEVREFAVSVVVSTHNRQDDLRGALQSLQHQVGGVPYEILIVDNNSSDDTRAVVERAIESSPVPLIYLFEPRQGVSYGRNTGILHARAPVIAITDDDCRAAPDWVAAIVRTLEKYPDVDCIGGRVVPVWPEYVPSWFTQLQTSPLAICEHGDRDLPVDAGHAAICLLTANLAVRRSAFDKAGVFSTEYPRGQDRELQLRMWGAGCRGLYAPGVVVTVPIPPERLKEPYFRSWYRKYGKVHARLELLDRLDKNGRLVSPPEHSRLFGTSPHVYRSFAVSILGWLSAVVRRREAERAYHANRICYFGNYIATSFKRAREAQPGSVLSHLARFLVGRLRRRFAPPRQTAGDQVQPDSFAGRG